MVEPLKHRWSIRHNYLLGITADDWWRLLRENGFGVDPAYWHRAALISILSCLNSLARRKEQRLFDAAVERTRVPPPLFVIGHWRTGTTLLQNLLAQDTEQFAFANTYQVVNPHTFLSTEEVNSRRFAWLVPQRRPMDNMALSFSTPQEDEFAPCLMSLRSLYLGISFPRRVEHYLRYLAFRGVPASEVDSWKRAFSWFLKKLTYKYDKPLVLKSPPHTARIRLLLELFPEARFVFIHRDPYAVFQSFRHYFDTAGWHTYLQRPPGRAGVDDLILRIYNELHDAFFAERHLIPAGRYHEIRFEDLERDPIGEMQSLYEHLQLPDFARVQPALERYVASLAGYRKNVFPALDHDLRARIGEVWRRSFDGWRYPL